VGKSIKPVLSVRKNVSCARHGKACDLCQRREIVQPLSSEEKQLTSGKRRKAFDLFQVQENMRRVPSGENMQLVVHAGKHATDFKRSK